MSISSRSLSFLLAGAGLLALLPGPASAQTVNLDAFDLPPGKTVTVEFQVTVDSPMPPGDSSVQNQGSVTGSNIAGLLTNDPDTVAADDPTVTTILLLADLSITKTDGATTEVPGTPVTYTIVAGNAGPATINDGVVTDTFPATLTGCGWTASVTAGTASGFDASGTGNINDTGITMASGGAITYVVTCNIAANATGSLVNTASIASAGTSDPTPANNSATDSDTLVPSTDVVITKTDGATDEVPGTSVTYTIVASNIGPSTATGVSVADTFPGILSGCSTTSVAAGGATGNDAGPTAGNLNDIGITLPPAAAVTYTATCLISAAATGSLANTATISAATTDPVPGNNSATDTDTLTPSADLAITKTDGAATEVPGSAVTYTIVASNAAGPSVATGVSVADSFPGILSGCSTTSVAAGGATGNDAGPVAGNLNDIGITLPTGSSVTYTATCNIDAAATGSLANTATVSSGVADPTPGNNSATDTDTLTVANDVAVTKTDGSATEVPGTPVTYTMVVSNPTGPSSATAVTFTDNFPAALTACSTTSVAAGGATGNDAGPILGNISDTGITVPTGGTVTYTAACTVAAAATGTLANTASVTIGGGGDGNAANNTATDTDTLVPAADLAITKTNGVSSVSPGSVVNYTIQVSNSGPSTATGITVADTFPATLSGCTWTTTTTGTVSGHDASGTGNINDSGITMAPAATLTYTTANCLLSAGATGSLSNTASVTATTADPNSGDNSATDTDTILPFDYGDAPNLAQSGFANSYPTLGADDGARHVATGPTLGTARDIEGNGQPSLGATADDTTGVPDDEDGVSFSATVACQAGTATVSASAPARLNAWLDWNRDGDWADVGEQMATDQLLAAGNNTVNFTVPCTASLGTSYARFRLSTATGLSFIGQSSDGEVEDHSVSLTGSSDLAVTKTDGLTSAVPGQTPVVYTIVASNAGPSPASGVSLTDTFPGVLSCGWTSANAGGASGNTNNPSAAALNETLSLPVGSTVTYTVNCTINPAATGTLSNTVVIASTQPQNTDPVAGNNSATDNTTLTPQVNLGVTKTDGATSAIPGTPVTYTIVVSNAGPSTDPNATLADTFAGVLSGCSTTSVAAGGASGNDLGPVAGNLNDTGLMLPPGGSVTYTATCNIAASATGTLVNTATATASVTDSNGSNNSATDSDTLVPTADLAITKTDGATSEIPGTPVTYTIVASNAAGPSVATSVSVADNFPAMLTACSTTSVAAGGATGNDAGPVAGAFTDAGITLPVGASVTYTASCTVASTAIGSLANTATVTTGITDPNATNNSATDTNTLTVTTDVSVTKTDGTTTEVPGTPVSYTIVVANSGPSTATAVTLADTFAATLSACSTTSVAAGGATGNDPGPVLGNLSDTGLMLPAGSAVTYTATCNIDPAATGSLVNTASVSGATGDTNSGNDSATDTDTLVPAADLAITKTDGAASVSPGATVNYTIVVSNAGPSRSTGITVADTFPATLTGCTWTTATTGSVSGHDASGTGNINDSGISMGPAATLTYATANCVLDGAASGTLANTATVNAATADPNPADNSATDTNTILPLDYGDAPSAAQSGFAGSYPVLQADNGARHVATGLTLGAARDIEANGQPSLGATGDDTTGAPDDEDGVSFATLTACQGGSATVAASAPGRLNGWIDWNRDGDWADAGEQVATDQLLAAGSNTVNFTVPCSVALGTSYARFRLATQTGLGFIGQAADGEIEDHSVTLTASGNLGVTKTDGLSTAVPGQTTVVYTIVASNAGPSPLAGVSLTDTFPGVLTCGWTSAAAGGATGNTSNPGAAALNELLSLPVGASVTYTVSCTINPAATGTLSNTATIATTLANTSDPTPGNNTATDNTTLTPQANLSVSKTDGATTEVPGTPVTYTIVVANAGPSVEPSATLMDSFAASLSGCSTTSVAAGGASGNDVGPVAGNLNDTGIGLPVGASVTYTATCNIAAGATGTLVNTATASGSVVDPSPGNNSATDTDTLTPQADLSITKTDGATSEVPGTSVTYTIVVGNAGPSVEPSATVADVFAASLSACSTTSVAAGGASGNDPGPIAGNLNDSAISLPVGSSVTYTATCTIAAGATGTLVNTAGVGSSVTDPNAANNSATDSDTLTPQGTLTITKTDGVTQATSGGTLTYTIFVSNGGPSTDPAVLVTDNFPAGLSCGWTSAVLGGATGNSNNAGPANLNDTLSLPPGASVTYTATCAIASSATGTLSNTATATTSIGGSSVSATDNNTVLVQSADLTIVKGADPLEAFPSMPLTYTIVVNNIGPSDAQNVVVTDNLPPDVTFVSSSGCNESPGGGAPTCTIGTLAAGSTRTVVYNTMVVADPSGSWTNTATVVSTTPDPTTPNSSTVTVVSDIIPPTVLALLDSNNVAISACSSLRRPVSTLAVRFDEEMEASVNGLGPDDANNPANYLLVTTGPDRDFATTGCQGGVAGDDVRIVINSVNYSIDSPVAPQSTAVLNLNGGARLSNGLYRLYACGTTTLTDTVGNPLDGNADGTGGDDFMRNFRVDTGNLFDNGHFDCSANGWTPTGAGIAFDPASDADASPRSGSEGFTTTNNPSQRIRQCVVFGQLGEAAPYLFTGRARMQGITPNAFIGASPECTFYGSGDCTGTSLGTQSQSGVVLSHTGGLWINLTFGVDPPAAALSANCGVTLDNPLQNSAVIGLDQLRLQGISDLFRDGFEGP